MMATCKNCGHDLAMNIDGKWKHFPTLPSAFGPRGCEWNCDCKSPEPKKRECENNNGKKKTC